MSIIFDLAAIFFGAFLFLFVFWRRLREDYSASLIFSSGFVFIFAILTGALLLSFVSGFLPSSLVFNPSQSWFWGAFAGSLAGLMIVKNKLRLKVVETFEASILGALSWACVIYAKNAELRLFAVSFLLILMFYFLEKRYRSFHWYKSGRVGFSGLFVAGLFFTARMLFALMAPGLFSSIGKVDILLSAVSAFLLFFSLYNLGEPN